MRQSAFPISNGMKKILDKLFGGPKRLKLIRLFIFSPETAFSVEEGMKKTGMNASTFRQEIGVLIKASFVKKIMLTREIKQRKARKIIVIRKKLAGFIYDSRFPFESQFKTMLLDTTPLYGSGLIRRMTKVGNIKLLVTSGVFIQNSESRLDLMVVGDRLNKKIMDRTVRSLEDEIGKELRYAIFETSDFNYRLGVYDRLVRDVLDYPHKKLVNKIGLGRP